MYGIDYDDYPADVDYDPSDDVDFTCPRCGETLSGDAPDPSVGYAGYTMCEACGLYPGDGDEWLNEDGTPWDGVITVGGVPTPEPDEEPLPEPLPETHAEYLASLARLYPAPF